MTVGGGPILPGAVLGVLGGGQLGRMFAMAAKRMGYRVAVFTPERDSPTAQLADRAVVAGYDDLDAVAAFAREVAVVTFEFENVPAATAAAAARYAPVRPAGAVLHTTQDRLREKTALRALGLPVAAFAEVAAGADDAALRTIVARIGAPAVLKTASWGYDGKGQAKVASDRGDAAAAAFAAIGRQRAVLEAFVPFERELSVVGARATDGSVALYPPLWNRHERHVLDLSVCPAPVPAAVAAQAHELARAVLEGLDVVGVLCVELFAMADGRLLINELAPRPHNSGHLTIEGFATSQFEQQVRAVCGLPLGSVAPTAKVAAMANLLGDVWGDAGGEPDWAAALAVPGVALHLYGKQHARPGRKMGHLTALGDDAAEVEQRLLRARAALVRR